MPKRPPAIVIPGRFLAHVEDQGGVVSISYDPTLKEDDDRWIVGYHFGHEEEDSEMAGGAAYGMADTAAEAFLNMLRDAGMSK